MAERTVSVALQAKVSGFVAGMRTAQKSAQSLNDRLQANAVANRQHMNTLATSAGLVGVAMVGAALVAVKSFAEFDSAMSKVQAATHESADNMGLLRQAALDAGRDTAFSATEAADAIEQLAKAGISTKDILGGGLKGALDLAAAGELEVGAAAEIAATAMTQFNLSGKDVPHIADLLAAAAGKAQGEVSDMAMALKQGGLVAAQMGLSIEETTGTLAAFASAGLIGSDAGTSLKTMLLRLANPSAEAAEVMKDLGISAYDAAGNFVGMENLAGQLQTRLSGMSQAQRDAALATIFGSDAIRSASVLYKQGASGIDSWTNKVDDSGFAAETAALKMDNLMGDLELLKGSFETMLIEMGEGADGPLRELVQQLDALVQKFSALPDPVKSGVLAFAGIGGVTLLAAAGIVKLITTISEVSEAMTNLGGSAGRMGTALKFVGVVGAVLAVASAIDFMGNKLKGLDVRASAVAVSLEKFGKSGKLTGDSAKLIGEDFLWLDDSLKRLGDPGKFLKITNGLDRVITPGWSHGVEESEERINSLDQALSHLASSGSAEEAASAFKRIAERAKEQGVSMRELKALFPEYMDTLRSSKAANEDAAKAQKKGADAAGQQADKVSTASDALQDMEERAQGLTDALELLNRELGNLDAESAYEAAIDDASARVKEFRKEERAGADSVKGMKGALDLGTAAGRDNAGAMRDLWRRTTDYASQIKKTTGDQGRANSVLGQGRAQLVAVATQFLGSKRAAERYVSEVLGIPKDVKTKYSTPGADSAIGKGREINRQADRANRTVTTRFVTIHTESVRRDPRAGQHGNRAVATGGLIDGSIPGGVRRMAAGGFSGPVRGPGTGTSDTAGLFALSNGEYVIKAASVMKYGMDFMDALNRGNLVSGSAVGGGTASASSPAFPAVEVQVFVGNREITDIVDVRMRESNRRLKREVQAGGVR